MKSSQFVTSGHKKSLGARSLRAGGWSMFTTISTYALRLISNLIMTRILLPEAFGMIAMAAVVLTALNMLTDIGISRSIVREKDGGKPHFLRVAWVVKLARNCVIAAAVLVAALLLSIFGPSYAPADSIYTRPEMPGLIALAALSPLLAGLTSTSLELTSRDMNYQRLTLFSIGSQIVSTICMVIFAQFSPTVWALMAGMLVGNLLLCLYSHTFLPGPRMKFVWDREVSDRLWHFGKWIMASSALGFVANNADKLILGALMGPTTFGIYVIAQIWIEAGKTLVIQMADRVGFPAIAEVFRDRPADVPRLFRKFQTIIDGICVMGFLTLLFSGQLLIDVLYSQTYQTAGTYLQIMSLGFLVVRFNTLIALVLNAGYSKVMLGNTAIIAASICIAIPWGFSFLGVEGAIFGAVLAPLMSTPYILYHTRKILGGKQTMFDIAWAITTVVLAIIIMTVKGLL